MTPARETAYRPDIDGLRAIAVTSVVVFHAFPQAIPGGFVGVDVFFAISGYLITRILLSQEVVSIRGFYARRVRRIVPALTLVLGACLVFGWFTLIPSEYQFVGKHALAGSLSVANLVLWRDAGYFAPAAQLQPLLHLWSLGVEEQYYLVWPFCVAALRGTRFFAPVLWTLGAASFFSCIGGAPDASFYLPSARFWEIGAGAGLALWSDERVDPISHRRAANAASWLGVSLLVLAFTLTRDDQTFPGAWPLLPVGGALLLMAAGPHTHPGRLLSTRPMVGVGLISYPLYLWHWPLLSFGRILLGAALGPRLRLAAIALAVVLAAVTYLGVERRVRVRQTSWMATGAWIAAIAMVGIGGAYLDRSGGAPSRVEPMPVPQRLITHEAPACPDALRGGDLDAIKLCRRSRERRGPPEVALLGDSHADHLFDALSDADGRGWILAANPSCPSVLGVEVQADQPGCREKFARILRYLASAEAASIHTVYLANFGGYALGTDFAADHLARPRGPSKVAIDHAREPAIKAQKLELGLEAYVAALLALHKHVVLIEDVPEFPFFPNACAARPSLATWLRERLGTLRCSIPRAAVNLRQADYLASIARIALRHPELRVVEMLDRVCTRALCPVTNERGALLYDDSHHLSTLGAQHVAASIVAELAAQH